MSTNERPKIKLALTKADMILEFIGWFSIIAVWGLTITNYESLPDIIQTHYNYAGEADSSGSKATIWILPLVATILFVGMTILNKYPHVFNYPINIKKDNALIQYRNATRMFRYLKLIIVIIFGLIVFKTIQQANGKADGLGIWFLPFMLSLIFVPLTYFVINSIRTKK